MSSSVHACVPNPGVLVDRAWRLGPELIVRATGVLLRHAIDTVFSNLSIETSTLPAKTVLTFGLKRVDHGRLRLFANGLPIISLSDELELAPALEGTLVGCAVRKRTDSAALHAASVELNGTGVLITGGKARGKSTLALALSNSGARYLGDEIAFVRYDGVVLETFPKAVTLKEGSFSLFPEVTTYLDPVRGRVRYHRPATAAPIGHHSQMGLIVIPDWTPDQDGVSITRVSAEELALELIREAFGGLERDRRMMALVRELAVVPAYRLAYRDLSAAVEAIELLVAESRE